LYTGERTILDSHCVALAIFSGKLFLYLQFWKICRFSRIASSREQKKRRRTAAWLCGGFVRRLEIA